MHVLFWALSLAFWVLGAMGLANERVFPKQQKWLAAVYVVLTAGWFATLCLSFTAR